MKLLLTLVLLFSGVSISFADDLPVGETGPGVPKFIELGPDCEMYVSQPGHGRILCLRNPDENGLYKTQTTFVKVESESRVHGLQWFKDLLWFTESGSIHKARSTKKTASLTM